VKLQNASAFIVE